jgi:hypothetical protein
MRLLTPLIEELQVLRTTLASTLVGVDLEPSAKDFG